MINKEFEGYLQDMALEQLLQTKCGEKLQQAIRVFEEVQKQMYALLEKNDSLGTVTIKTGTVLMFAVLRKIAEGKLPVNFDSADWKEIADSVSKYAILQDNQSYSIFVICMYENYIRFSADLLEVAALNRNADAVRSLANELAEKTELLQKAQITEVNYIEDCLWISLEAMFKLIAATSIRIKDDTFTEFTHALAIYAFEYGRFMLFKREEEIVNQFIQSQYMLDEELEKKYSRYLEELKQESEQFYELIDNAFSPTFRECFLHSITLAHEAGVKSEDILKTREDIDSFFMD